MRGRVYVEGFWLADHQARLGAWSASLQGEVLHGPVAEAYLGVPMSEPYRTAITRRTGSAGILIAAPANNWRLLEKGIPTGAMLNASYRPDKR